AASFTSLLGSYIFFSCDAARTETYTLSLHDALPICRQGVDDAVLLVVARDDRRVRIQPGYGLEGAIPDITAGRIIQEYMAPKFRDRKSTRLNSSHVKISYAVFCLKKKKKKTRNIHQE